MDANSTPTAPAPTTIRVFGISGSWRIERLVRIVLWSGSMPGSDFRSEEHTSELQSQSNLVCRLLLEKKKFRREHHVVPRHQYSLKSPQQFALRPRPRSADPADEHALGHMDRREYPLHLL